MRCGGNVGDGDGDALRSGVGERPGGSGLPDAVAVGEALGVGVGEGLAVGDAATDGPAEGAAEPLPSARGEGGGGVASWVATASRYVLLLSLEL
jgi:hypothetical protein